jgi:hypothetical protein
MSVKKASAIQPTGHGIHVAIQHITGAMSLGMVVSQHKAIDLGTQFENCIQDRPNGIFLNPLEQFLGFRTENICISDPLDLQHTVRELVKNGFHVTTTLADFEESMQEAFDDDNQWKQGQPSFLGSG